MTSLIMDGLVLQAVLELVPFVNTVALGLANHNRGEQRHKDKDNHLISVLMKLFLKVMFIR